MVVTNVLCETNVCFWNTLKVRMQRIFASQVFCCHPDGQWSFPSVRFLEELSATVTMCVKKYGLWHKFLLSWDVCEFTQNFKPGQHLLLPRSFMWLSFLLHFTAHLRIYHTFLSLVYGYAVTALPNPWHASWFAISTA